MDELIFLLILAGIGVILLVAMFTYYKHHKKIHDEIKDFNHHAYAIDDVLLNDQNHDAAENNSRKKDDSSNNDLPGSFSASRQEHFDIDDIQLKHDSFENNAVDSPATKAIINDRELVDGVYINTKRVIRKADYDDSLAESQLSSMHEENMEDRLTTASDSMPLDRNEPQIMHRAPGTQMTDKPVIASKPDDKTNSQKISIVYDPLPDGVEDLIISHTILTKGEHFTGTQLFHALQSAGLFYGEMDIFHYPGDDDAETYALFSVANVVEPGTFNPQAPEALRTPGISMFMRLPTRMGSYDAYEKFIEVAQMIATELGGELCDEARNQLTQQVISYKKEQIRKLNFDMAKAEKLAGTTR